MTIGHIQNRPIIVSFSFDYIENQLICFYTGISPLVDHTMIKDFLTKNFPIKYNESGMCDAMNFHNCAAFCRAAADKENFKCPYCEAPKSNQLGICKSCGRFPNNTKQSQQLKEKEEKDAGIYVGFVINRNVDLTERRI